jgi:tetratricopeptide (TPR) repeat protein
VQEHLYPGLLELERGRIDTAASTLLEAEGALTAYADMYGPDRSFHAQTWFAVAAALLAAGDEEGAAGRFQKIVDSYVERAYWPREFVRSLFYLGKFHAERGDSEQARDYLRRFLNHWGDGEIDRDRVAEAREVLAGL